MYIIRTPWKSFKYDSREEAVDMYDYQIQTFLQEGFELVKIMPDTVVLAKGAEEFVFTFIQESNKSDLVNVLKYAFKNKEIKSLFPKEIRRISGTMYDTSCSSGYTNFTIGNELNNIKIKLNTDLDENTIMIVKKS